VAKRKAVSDPEKQFNVAVGQRICRARRVAGLTAGQLGDAAGISSTQVYWYEVGRNRCPPFVLSKFANRLKIPLQDLVPNLTCSGIPENSGCDDGKLF